MHVKIVGSRTLCQFVKKSPDGSSSTVDGVRVQIGETDGAMAYCFAEIHKDNAAEKEYAEELVDGLDVVITGAWQYTFGNFLFII